LLVIAFDASLRSDESASGLIQHFTNVIETHLGFAGIESRRPFDAMGRNIQIVIRNSQWWEASVINIA